MDIATSAGQDLERAVRQELLDAGFTVEPSLMSADGGLGVWHDPTRGVVITWGTTADHLVRHATIRSAVLLALRTVLLEAGHQVREDFNGLELIVTD
ncbi:hypothetical protein [Nonomuraea gerenzanensis]|uniref:Uncharacterized protein n=1 Tax=Nonomuraea gerenzanensis TaxID=93944 RepID=A0A1M4E9C8_9ACTN|nr:hypothetical protein [Nonomuraea gerenzanensis]UBU17566.1 hypothetical protein LCN96_21825 [Nonomuraea gerenzanensis]SBO95328.1 hypothetical protein BN4615_P4844 [Nonomuraea gerenzanensis]